MCANRMFSPEGFRRRVFSKEPFDKEFLNKWENKRCIDDNKNRIIKGTYPWQWVVRRGHLDVYNYLVKNGTDVKACGCLAIRIAVKEGHFDMVKYLLNTNAYSEELIQQILQYYISDINIYYLLANYRQFPNTKACR